MNTRKTIHKVYLAWDFKKDELWLNEMAGGMTMNTRKTIHKVYLAWDFKKEELWLNEMAAEGWALEHAAFCSYTFVRCEPGEYIIRMEMNADRDYRSFVEETGAEYVGGCVNWIYFRRKAELGSFDLFSDIDSRIAHLARIGKSLWLICLANLIIGVVNIIDGQTFSIVNLLCSVLLAYGLGRIHGMKASLEEERALYE